MLDIAAHRLADGSWIRTMPIGDNLIGSMPNHSNSLLEKPLGGFHISLLAQHGINQIAIRVNGPIQITPLPMHFQVGFIHMPGFPALPMSLVSYMLYYERGKPCLPVSDRFIGECET